MTRFTFLLILVQIDKCTYMYLDPEDDPSVTSKTAELRNTVDAAKALLRNSRTPTRTKKSAQREKSPQAAPARCSDEELPVEYVAAVPTTNSNIPSTSTNVLHQQSAAMHRVALERDAAIDEAKKLRRQLDEAGDVHQRIKEAVRNATEKERAKSDKELEGCKQETNKLRQLLRDNATRYSMELQQKDERIQVLAAHVSSVSTQHSPNRTTQLQEQVSSLTAELLRRDSMLDEKTSTIAALQQALDRLEEAVSVRGREVVEMQQRGDQFQRDLERERVVAQRDNDSWTFRLAEANREIDERNAECLRLTESLKQAIANAEQAALEFEANLDSKDSMIQNLHQQIEKELENQESLKQQQRAATSCIRESFFGLLHSGQDDRRRFQAFSDWKQFALGRRDTRERSLRQFHQATAQLALDARESFALLQREYMDETLTLIRFDRKLLGNIVIANATQSTLLMSEITQTKANAQVQMSHLRNALDASRKREEELRMELHSALRDAASAKDALTTQALVAAARGKEESDATLLPKIDELTSALNTTAKELNLEQKMRLELEGTLADVRAELEASRMALELSQNERAVTQSSLTHLRAAFDESNAVSDLHSAEWSLERRRLLTELNEKSAVASRATTELVQRDLKERELNDMLNDVRLSRANVETELVRTRAELQATRAHLERTKESLNTHCGIVASLGSASPSRSPSSKAGTKKTSPTPSTVSEEDNPSNSTRRDEELASVPNKQDDTPDAESKEGVRADVEVINTVGVEHEEAVITTQLSESVDEVTALRALVDSLRSQLTFVETECSWWKAQADRMEGIPTAITESPQRIVELQVESLQQQLSQTHETNGSLAKLLSETREQRDALQKKANESEVQVKQLQRLQYQLSQVEEEKALLRAQLESSQSLQENILKHSSEKLPPLERELTHLRHDYDSAMKRADAQKESLQQEVKQLRSENHLLVDEISEIRAFSSEMQRAYDLLSKNQPQVQRCGSEEPPMSPQRSLARELDLVEAASTVRKLEAAKSLLEARLGELVEQQVTCDEHQNVAITSSRRVLQNIAAALNCCDVQQDTSDEACLFSEEMESRMLSEISRLKSGGISSDVVETLLERIVDTHRREVRNLSLVNASLIQELNRLDPVAAAMVSNPEALQCLTLVAGSEAQLKSRCFHVWRLHLERRRREEVTRNAQRTIQRLQEQQTKLKEIAEAAVHRARDLESVMKYRSP